MYEVKYGGSDSWESISEAKVRERLDGYYVDVDLVMDAMHQGDQVHTAFALYRWRDDTQEVK